MARGLTPDGGKAERGFNSIPLHSTPSLKHSAILLWRLNLNSSVAFLLKLNKQTKMASTICFPICVLIPVV